MRDKLPKGWVKTTLGDVLQVIRGVTYTSSQARGNPAPGYLPILRATNIQQKLNFENLVYVPERNVSEAQKLRLGDIVIAASSGSKSVVGKAAPLLSQWEGSFGAFCFGLRPSPEINASYVARFLQTTEYRHRVSDLASGSNINNLRAQHISETPFPLAPLPEQERIVTKLDTLLSHVEAGEAAGRRAQERLKRYRAAVLNAAVSGELTRDWRKTHKPDETGAKLLKRLLQERRARWEEAELKRLQAAGKAPENDKWKKRYPKPRSCKVTAEVKPPRGWTWASFEQVSLRVTVGHVGSMKREYVSRGVPFLRSQNIRANRFDPEGLLYISPKFHAKLSKSRILPGDVAVVRSGNVGTTCVIPESLGEANCSDLVLIQRPLIEPHFIAFYMNSAARKHVESGKVGVALTHFNTASVASLAIAVPPESEQVEIVRRVQLRLAAADRLPATLEGQLKRARTSRQSLLHAAFAGKLVPQNPKDEPASVLLERIHANRESEAEIRRKQPKPQRGARRRQEGNIAMNQIVPTSEALLAAWHKIRKKPDAQRLFQAARYLPGQVVEFYEMLRATPEVRESFEAASKANSRGRKRMRTAVADEEKSKGHFRLGALWLENFKNLKNYGVNFNPSQGLDVILGWNGTGKSNLFEALVLIFRDLHYWREKNRWPEEAPAAYRIAYEIEEQLVEVTWTPSKMKRPAVRRAVIPKGKSANLKLEEIKREELPLPRFVFGYYSGPTNRLAEHFLPMKRDHYERLRKASSDDPKTLAKLLKQRRFFCASEHKSRTDFRLADQDYRRSWPR